VIYDRLMSRLAVLAGIVVTLCGATTVSSAQADPARWPCDIRLTPPAVVDVSGRQMVTATVDPAGCTVAAEPTMSVACLQLQGSQSAEQCAQQEGPGTARVYYAPYRPGATYIATGRGCANVGNPPTSVCQTAGPLTAVPTAE
jgi:hypothetical protein